MQHKVYLTFFFLTGISLGAKFVKVGFLKYLQQVQVGTLKQ